MILVTLGVACGGKSPGKPNDETPTLDYFPLAVGTTWTYLVTAGAGTKDKTTTVEAYEDIGDEKTGVVAYRIHTDKVSGETVSWQSVNGSVLERHREQSIDGGQITRDEYYDPFKLRLNEADDHTALGMTWVESYTETATDFAAGSPVGTSSSTKAEQWSVEAVDANITVPAGTFDCLQLRRASLSGGSTKIYWFAKGVGKIKEVGDGQTEELKSYELAE